MQIALVHALFCFDAHGPVVPVAVWPFPNDQYVDIPERAARYIVQFSGGIVSELPLYDFTVLFSASKGPEHTTFDLADLLVQHCYESARRQSVQAISRVEIYAPRFFGEVSAVTCAGSQLVTDERGAALQAFRAPWQYALRYSQWVQLANELKLLISQRSYARKGSFATLINLDLEDFMQAYLGDRALFTTAQQTTYGSLADMLQYFQLSGDVFELELLTAGQAEQDRGQIGFGMQQSGESALTKASLARQFFEAALDFIDDVQAHQSLGVGVFAIKDGQDAAERVFMGLVRSEEAPHLNFGPWTPEYHFLPEDVLVYRNKMLVVFSNLVETLTALPLSDFNIAANLKSAVSCENYFSLTLKSTPALRILHYAPSVNVLGLESEYFAMQFSQEYDRPRSEQEIAKQDQLRARLDQDIRTFRSFSPEFDCAMAAIAAYQFAWQVPAFFEDFLSGFLSELGVKVSTAELLFLSNDEVEMLKQPQYSQYAEYTHAAVNYSLTTGKYTVLFAKDPRETLKSPGRSFSPGEIAAIVCGAVLLLVLVGVAAWAYKSRKWCFGRRQTQSVAEGNADGVEEHAQTFI